MGVMDFCFQNIDTKGKNLDYFIWLGMVMSALINITTQLQSLKSVLRLVKFLHYFLHGKSEFPANIYKVNGWRTINQLFSKNLTGKAGSLCYSATFLGNLGTYVKNVGVAKFLQSIITWYMNLLTLSYPLQHTKKLVT